MPEVSYIGSAAILAKVVEGAHRGVSQAAEDLVGKSQAAAPVDTGTLRGSIHVSDVSASGMGVEAKVETGGEAFYAIFQHEGTSRGVPATKFMEGPLIANASLYQEMIARAIAF